MGNFLRKSNDEYKDRISELSKTITSPHSYDSAVSVMFDDGKFNLRRVEAWYIMSCTVRHHLPVHQHPLLYHYFWKWMSIFTRHLPRAKRQLQMMKRTWWTIPPRENNQD